MLHFSNRLLSPAGFPTQGGTHVALLVLRQAENGGHEVLVAKNHALPEPDRKFHIRGRQVGEGQLETYAIKSFAEVDLGIDLTREESAVERSVLVYGGGDIDRVRCFLHQSTADLEAAVARNGLSRGDSWRYEFVPLSTFAQQKVTFPGIEGMQFDEFELKDLLTELMIEFINYLERGHDL